MDARGIGLTVAAMCAFLVPTAMGGPKDGGNGQDEQGDAHGGAGGAAAAELAVGAGGQGGGRNEVATSGQGTSPGTSPPTNYDPGTPGSRGGIPGHGGTVPFGEPTGSGGGGGGISSGGGGGGYRDTLISSQGGGGGGGGGATGITLSGGAVLSSIQGGFGGNGGSGRGGGGGGGGGGTAAILSSGTYTLASGGLITGGRGGAGGASLENGGGGGGGAAGYGVSLTQGVLLNRGSIVGGTGGNGGSATDITFHGEYGFSGRGGIGLSIRDSIVYNEGSIFGGQGGQVIDNGQVLGTGRGGVAITGSNVTVINSGTIVAGTRGANLDAIEIAVLLAGGTNTLVLHAGSYIDGRVVATGHDTFALGGAGTGTFNVGVLGSTNVNTGITGFSSFEKRDSGTWNITGSSAVANSWLVKGGVLSVETAGVLGTGVTTVDGSIDPTATLRVRNSGASVTASNHIVLNNGGSLVNFGIMDGQLGAGSQEIIYSGTGGAHVTNHGTISHASRAAILLEDGGTVDNYNTLGSNAGGIISVGERETIEVEINNHDGAILRGGIVSLNKGVTRVTNAGEITSSNATAIIVQNARGTVNNTGTISGALDGMILLGESSVENSGLIQGGFIALRLAGGGIVNNAVGGRIIAGTGQRAIEAQAATELVNSGSIRGDVELEFMSKNTVTLQKYGVIQGNLRIGENTESQLILSGTAVPGDDTPSLYSQTVTGQTHFSGTLRKTGSQTWKLDRNLDPTRTRVEEGILILSGTLGGSSIQVAANGTLQLDEGGKTGANAVLEVDGDLAGAGTVGGDAIIRGQLTPSESPDARITFEKSLTLTSEATTVLIISPEAAEGGTNTSVAANSMILGGDFIMVISGLLQEESGQWLLFDAPDLSGAFDSVSLAGLYNLNLFRNGDFWSGEAGGYAWTFNQNDGSLQAEAVPEPSTWLLLGLGVGVILLARRRAALKSAGASTRVGRNL